MPPAKSKTYKKNVSLSEARKMMVKLRGDLRVKRSSEEAALQDAVGRELAEDVVARRAFPPHNVSLMDGFAVKFEDTNPLRQLVKPVHAGDRTEKIPQLEKGTACPISTGAFLPDGANAVVKVEDARTEGERLITPSLEKWMNVGRKGSHYRKGTKLIREGSVIRPQELALLTEIGEDSVTVYNRLRVGVFASGEELARGVISDTNSPMIMATLERWGYEPVWLGVARDKPRSMEGLLKKGLKTCDVVISSGAISMGVNDYLPEIIDRLGSIIFRRITVRPGKPLLAAVIGEKPVFCLPGKPTGAFTALNLIVRAFFRPRQPFPVVRKKLAQTVLASNSGYSYVVFLTFKGSKKAYPLGYRLSGLKILDSGIPYLPGIISSTTRAAVADGFLLTDQDLLQGETVEVNLLT